jgi:hypothetical protein
MILIQFSIANPDCEFCCARRVCKTRKTKGSGGIVPSQRFHPATRPSTNNGGYIMKKYKAPFIPGFSIGK